MTLGSFPFRLRAGLIALKVLLSVNAADAGTAGRSVYFYGLEGETPARWQTRLAHWRAAGIDRVIGSLEAGPALLLDDEAEARHLAGLFRQAVERGIQVEGLILQDPDWVLRPEAARERLRVVGEFARNHPGLLAGVQIDVEVYTAPELVPAEKAWAKFAALVALLRQDLAADYPALRLSAALPWWVAYALPQAEWRALTQALDEIVLMAYGDPGGQPVAANAEVFREKVFPAVLSMLARGLRIRIGVAKYEHSSTAALDRHTENLEKLLAGKAGFAGIAFFHEGSEYLTQAKLEPSGLPIGDLC